RGRHEVHRHSPGVGAGDRDVEVVPVASLRAGRESRGAATAAATSSTPAAATAPTGATLAHRDVGGAAATAPGLGREDLVVQRAQVHAVAGPGVEEVLRGDGAAAGRRGTDRQVLLEGTVVALDAGLVDLLVLVDVVRAAVTGHLPHVRAGRVRRAAVVLLHVVLDQRIGRPPIQRDQCGSAGGAKASVETDRVVAAGVPADAGDEVTDAAPPGRVTVA